MSFLVNNENVQFLHWNSKYLLRNLLIVVGLLKFASVILCWIKSTYTVVFWWKPTTMVLFIYYLEVHITN